MDGGEQMRKMLLSLPVSKEGCHTPAKQGKILLRVCCVLKRISSWEKVSVGAHSPESEHLESQTYFLNNPNTRRRQLRHLYNFLTSVKGRINSDNYSEQKGIHTKII